MSDELVLGPIVGVDENKALIWFKDTPNNNYVVKYAEEFSVGDSVTFTSYPDSTCICALNNLKANTEYNFSIQNPDSSHVYAKGRFATFPKAGEDLDFSFSFFSCHKPEEDGSLVMWDRLSGICHEASRINNPASLRFCLAIGDQIYADELGKAPKQYLKMDEESLTVHFDSRYNEFWRFRSIRNVFSRCPAYMMWDDHEIRDGWGSRKSDFSNKQLKKVFKAAEEAFIRHQLSYNPFCPSPLNKKYYSFRFAQAGFIVLDLRGERNAKSKKIMSDTQWEWFKKTINSYCSRCKAVFLITTVPFYHPVRGVAKAVVDIKDIFSKDEMEDSWSDKQWRNEGIKFADIIIESISLPGRRARLYLLGGDAHIATAGEIRLGTDLMAVKIPQFTSSAISNAAPGALKLVSKNIQDRSWRKLYDKKLYEARLPHLIAARNFGVVRVTPGKYGKQKVKFELHHELSDAKMTLYDDGEFGKPICVK